MSSEQDRCPLDQGHKPQEKEIEASSCVDVVIGGIILAEVQVIEIVIK